LLLNEQSVPINNALLLNDAAPKTKTLDADVKDKVSAMLA
jgi:hypothetical protein